MNYYFDSGGNFKFTPAGKLCNPAWANVLTNGRLSCTVTERFSGNLWYSNAREFRVTPWSNDPCAKFGPERFTVNGMSPFAADDGISCEVTYGFGFARWEKAGVSVMVWINPDADTRIMQIRKSGGFTVSYDGEFVLGADSSDAKVVTVGEDGGILTVRSLNRTAPEFKISSNGRLELVSEPGLTRRLSAKFTARDSLTILSGFGELRCCPPETVCSYWRQTVNMPLCGDEQGRTAAWLTYQTLACRVMARGSIYQSGGAYGFRDQLQDVCMLLGVRPELTREHILLCAEHQYEEGDVQHWWHPPRRGVRTRCSDDLLWLVWAVCEYCAETGDRSILDESAAYLHSEPLADEERERYETPQVSSNSEPLLRHCERALNLVRERGTDECGILKIGSGDWNDGFDMMSGGSSVWLTWFAAGVFARYGELTGSLGYTEYAKQLGEAANSTFNGKYFERAYYSDGTPLLILDSVAQSWAVLSGFGDPENSKTALRSALDALYDREHKLVKLFTPPFRSGNSKSPGYVSAYLPGVRENGGQYTHAAVWLALACLKTPGFESDGKQILRDLLPFNHDTGVYRAEPFVMAADVYTHPSMYGRAGWTWYTGASGWMLRAINS